ncbi:hypothetical protein KCU61_g119, partial [Aureobasidium melanogenum]
MRVVHDCLSVENAGFDFEVSGHGAEDVDTVVHIGHVTKQTLVQTTGTEKSRIDQIRSTGSSKDKLVDDAIGNACAVVSSLWCYTVKLVEEEYTRACGFCPIEQVADTLFRSTNQRLSASRIDRQSMTK